MQHHEQHYDCELCPCFSILTIKYAFVVCFFLISYWVYRFAIICDSSPSISKRFSEIINGHN